MISLSPGLAQGCFELLALVTQNPAWVQGARYGRSRVLSFAGSEIAQTFVEARLSGNIDDETIAFWDMIASRARGQRDSRLLSIGRHGERLTLKYEAERTGHSPRWISIDDNADGYDVLSIVSSTDHRQLSIEVKTSTVGTSGSFHLSSNEWERAIEVEFHNFHLWNIRNPGNPSLAVVSTETMKDHIPKDCGQGCWEQVEIPFAVFDNKSIAIMPHQ